MLVLFYINICNTRQKKFNQHHYLTSDYQLGKTVPPVPASELVFKVLKLDKCSSKILLLKQTQASV